MRSTASIVEFGARSLSVLYRFGYNMNRIFIILRGMRLLLEAVLSFYLWGIAVLRWGVAVLCWGVAVLRCLRLRWLWWLRLWWYASASLLLLRSKGFLNAQFEDQLSFPFGLLDPLEYSIQGPLNYAVGLPELVPAYLVLRAHHRVGLAGSALPIAENTVIFFLKNRIYHILKIMEYLLLLYFRFEAVINLGGLVWEGELALWV